MKGVPGEGECDTAMHGKLSDGKKVRIVLISHYSAVSNGTDGARE